MKPTLLAALAFLMLLTQPLPAIAQAAGGTVRLVVPLAPGGPSDQAARLLANAMGKVLGQDVIVENKPGALGAVGAQMVAALPADGRTLLFAPSGMIGLPVLLKNPPFASMSELTSIGSVGGNQICLFVHPSLPVNSVREFVAHAKANPDKLSYGSSSAGEYLISSQFLQTTNTQMVRIPYKGSAQMMPDFLEGRVQVAFIPAGAGAPHAKSGRAKLLACNATQRLPGLMEVPTLAEAGIPNIGWHTVHLILAPARMPGELSTRLAAAVRQAANDPNVRAEYERMYIPIDILTPEQTSDTIKKSEVIWTKFVREANIAPE
jgi:tripartite-type tricarboxylate transporter receptor subunit TctC